MYVVYVLEKHAKGKLYMHCLCNITIYPQHIITCFQLIESLSKINIKKKKNTKIKRLIFLVFIKECHR